jgi:ribosomal protein S18 acetylase RimI-like enzyme
MTYRKAKADEAEAIAKLHTKSWQIAYRGILTDTFLDNEVLENRLKIWTERFQNPSTNEFICVAVDDETINGFVCVYGNDDAQWGALIDNLHVLPELKGQGIGKRLMEEATKWVRENYLDSGIYLWVYKANHLARHFYDKMGGEIVEEAVYNNPGGGTAHALRYIWTIR